MRSMDPDERRVHMGCAVTALDPVGLVDTVLYHMRRHGDSDG